MFYKLSIQVEQTVNKTLIINCYNSPLKISFKTFIYNRKFWAHRLVVRLLLGQAVLTSLTNFIIIKLRQIMFYQIKLSTRLSFSQASWEMISTITFFQTCSLVILSINVSKIWYLYVRSCDERLPFLSMCIA